MVEVATMAAKMTKATVRSTKYLTLVLVLVLLVLLVLVLVDVSTQLL